MNYEIEKNLHASKWRFAKKVLGGEAFDRFRRMQIDAFRIQLYLERCGINVSDFDYFLDRNSVYFEVAIPSNSRKEFYEIARSFWNFMREDMPLHRNDSWVSEAKRPKVSDLYADPANGNLIIQIKTNPKSKCYSYCTSNELMASDDLTQNHSLRYFEVFLK